MTNEEIRAAITSGIDTLLSRPFVRAGMSDTQVALCRAQRDYWQMATDADLTRLGTLFHLARTTEGKMDNEHKAKCVAAMPPELTAKLVKFPNVDWMKLWTFIQANGPTAIRAIEDLLVILGVTA